MHDQTVAEFRRHRRTLILRGAAEAGVYPAVVIVWAVVLALVVGNHPSYPLPPVLPHLLRDSLTLAAVTAAAAPFAIRHLQYRQHELRWLYYWFAVRSRLENEIPLTDALIPEGETARGIPRTVIVQGIARGNDPGVLLGRTGCPRKYVDLVTAAACSAELVALLAEELSQAVESYEHTLSVRLRLAQPAGILLAGAVVVWVVGRVVRPVLILQMEGMAL